GGGEGGGWQPRSGERRARRVQGRPAAIAAVEGVDPAAVSADALTASASRLDPAISLDYALLQVPRVAAARGLDEDAVRALDEEHTEGRELGYLGEPTVDVLELTTALARL
ncbi:potassium-transporting ATPase subunit C, partial [Rathayibacter rathayi]